MFTPLPMQRITLSLLKDDAAHAALLLARYGCFNPEVGEITPQQLPELPGTEYRRSYEVSRSRLDKILAHYRLDAPATPDTPLQAVSLEQLAQLEPWLKQAWEHCSEQQERTRKLRDDRRHSVQLLKALDQFMTLNIDLALLQKNSSVLDLRIGTLPRVNIQRFEEALALAGYLAIRFYISAETVHLIIAGPRGQANEIERVLQAAGWRTAEIPAEFKGRPAEVRNVLNEQIAHHDRLLAEAEASCRAAPEQDGLREKLFAAAHTLALAAPYAGLALLMRGRGSLAMVSGWIPERQLPRLHEMLQKDLGNRYLLHARAPRADERLQVPSLIQHHRWLRPFASLVLNYGVPRYGEIDPTILFAVSFVLMFGMMFGDVGQGATIALAGLFFRQRLGQYRALAIAMGSSSACFGLLYGSVFGFEEVLPALWMPPLSDPLRMLGIALSWGIGFISLATVLTIRNRIAEGRLQEALLDSHGAAGLTLYLGLILAGYGYATSGTLDILALLLALSALGAILYHTWRHNRAAPTWERMLISLMEAFESVMSYISNTLSFLRLAAFSLNHVALTIAIFTIGSMMHATGYWASVVLGNVFILVLEGGIVAIQTLRLEYYEGFSRFFGGDGRAFQPLTLQRPDPGQVISTNS